MASSVVGRSRATTARNPLADRLLCNAERVLSSECTSRTLLEVSAGRRATIRPPCALATHCAVAIDDAALKSSPADPPAWWPDNPPAASAPAECFSRLHTRYKSRS